MKGYEFNGMLNIGKRPTVDGFNRKIEVHIIGFNEEIYNERISITFVKKIRDEKKFKSLDHLKIQLQKDKEMIMDILK